MLQLNLIEVWECSRTREEEEGDNAKCKHDADCGAYPPGPTGPGARLVALAPGRTTQP